MNLYLLPAGSPVKNPLELLNMRQAKRSSRSCRAAFNWAIFDTPPLLFSADANLLATLADGTILVVKIGSTTFDNVTRAMQSLCENNVLGHRRQRRPRFGAVQQVHLLLLEGRIAAQVTRDGKPTGMLRATMEFTQMKRFLVVLAAGAAALSLASCKHSPPANVAAEVNGHAITYAELDKTYQSNAQQAEGANEDQVMSQKLDLLSSLITQRDHAAARREAGPDGGGCRRGRRDLNKMRRPTPRKSSTNSSPTQHMTLDDLKAKMRSKLTVDKLVNKEITSQDHHHRRRRHQLLQRQQGQLQPRRAASPHGADPGDAVPGPECAQSEEQQGAERERGAGPRSKDIAAQLRQGEDFAMLAQNYSEDPQLRAQRRRHGVRARERSGPGQSGIAQAGGVAAARAASRRSSTTPEGYRILKVISGSRPASAN